MLLCPKHSRECLSHYLSQVVRYRAKRKGFIEFISLLPPLLKSIIKYDFVFDADIFSETRRRELQADYCTTTVARYVTECVMCSAFGTLEFGIDESGRKRKGGAGALLHYFRAFIAIKGRCSRPYARTEELFWLRIRRGWSVRRDDVVMERVFYVQGLVRTAIQTTEVGVVFCEEKIGLNDVYFWINFKVIRWSSGWRRWQAV
jgi:hypothetical protein